MRIRAAAIGLLSGALCLGGCTGESPLVSEREGGVRYVALGDSYTVGTSVTDAERWPNQLVERVDALDLVGNPAVNGYTSTDLINEELPLLDGLRPELVSVLIGVNDVVQGVSDLEYAGNVTIILEELRTRLPAERILCVATPDYTLTPQGAGFGDEMQQRDAIVRFNAILREACEAQGMRFVPEIFEISQLVRDDPSLVASDGLHPSGAQYRLWVDAIEPVVVQILE